MKNWGVNNVAGNLKSFLVGVILTGLVGIFATPTFAANDALKKALQRIDEGKAGTRERSSSPAPKVQKAAQPDAQKLTPGQRKARGIALHSKGSATLKALPAKPLPAKPLQAKTGAKGGALSSKPLPVKPTSGRQRSNASAPRPGRG